MREPLPTWDISQLHCLGREIREKSWCVSCLCDEAGFGYMRGFWTHGAPLVSLLLLHDVNREVSLPPWRVVLAGRCIFMVIRMGGMI